MEDVHFLGRGRHADWTACYSLFSRLGGDCSGTTAAGIPPLSYSFGALSKPHVSRSWDRNRPSGRAQTRSWRTLLGELARRRAPASSTALVDRSARTLLGHRDGAYRLQH